MTAQKQTQNSKTGNFRELFLPENGSKTISTVILSKKTCRYWRPGTQPKTYSLGLNFFYYMPFDI